MRRAIDPKDARLVIDTASEQVCPHCQGVLRICQHRDRFIFRLDGLVHYICRDKSCPDQEWDGHGIEYRPLVDLRLALPRMSFGLDVVVAVGERHLLQGRSLSELGRELTDQGVPVHQTHVGRLLRNFLALCKMARGGEQQVRQRLLNQGGMVLMVDGVQFDDRSPVLYLCWDALSGSPLFGERMESRDMDALSGLLHRVKRMEVPVLGVVTDAERGLVSAVHKVFPQVPYHLCPTHFLKNCAKPMDLDLRQLGQSVAERAERVRKMEKRLDKKLAPVSRVPAPPEPQSSQEPACGSSSRPPAAEPITEPERVKQMCALGRLDARASGKAPLAPPEQVRHQRLEELRQVVDAAAQKKARRPRPGWMS